MENPIKREDERIKNSINKEIYSNELNKIKEEKNNKIPSSCIKMNAKRYNIEYTNLTTGSFIGPTNIGKNIIASSIYEKPATKIIIPSCSSWFSFDSINPLEKRMLPEFFMYPEIINHSIHSNINNNIPNTIPPNVPNINTPTTYTKTPQLYVQYRNYMINTYRNDPTTYLTATICRRNLSGDACSILRVHEFLQHWGLINYQVESINEPYDYKKNIKTNINVRNQEILKNSSSHHENNIKINPNENKIIIPEWKEEETKRLIQAIETNLSENNTNDNKGINWKEISTIVKTRNEKECIMKFLELPNTKNDINNQLKTNDKIENIFGDLINRNVLLEYGSIMKKVQGTVAKAAANAAMDEIIKQREKSKNLIDKKIDENNNQSIVHTDIEIKNETIQNKKDTKINDLNNEIKAKKNKINASLADTANMETSAAVTVASLAVNAEAMSREKEETIKKLMDELMENQIKKIELKLLEFQEIEKAVLAEKEQLTKDRYDLYLEQIKFAQDKMNMEM